MDIKIVTKKWTFKKEMDVNQYKTEFRAKCTDETHTRELVAKVL